MRLFPLLLLVVVAGCAPKLPEGADGGALRKRLYLDANLACSVAVPDAWSRRFVAPPPSSPVSYAVAWEGPIAGAPERSAQMNLALLKKTAPDDIAAALEGFAAAHPGFTITARKPLGDQPGAPQVILGHTPARLYQVVHIPAAERLYRIDQSTPPEDFTAYQPLFDLILDSFQPLD